MKKILFIFMVGLIGFIIYEDPQKPSSDNNFAGEPVNEPENYSVVGEPVIYLDGDAVKFYVIDLADRQSKLQRAILVRDLARSVILNSTYKEATVFLLPNESEKGTGNLLARANCVYSKCEVYAGIDVDSVKRFTFPE